MSNYKYNNNALSGIFAGGDTPADGYTGLTFKALTSGNVPYIRHSSLVGVGFKSGGTDFVETFLPYYREYTVANQANADKTIPSWCTKLYVILIGGGGRQLLGW